MNANDENVLNVNTLDETHVVELLFAEGEALMEVHSYEAAVAKFDQVLAHDPNHEQAFCRRAVALEHMLESRQYEQPGLA